METKQNKNAETESKKMKQGAKLYRKYWDQNTLKWEEKLSMEGNLNECRKQGLILSKIFQNQIMTVDDLNVAASLKTGPRNHYYVNGKKVQDPYATLLGE